MKNYFIAVLAVFAFSGVVSAQTITFQWDASPGVVDGYSIWQGVTSASYTRIGTVNGTTLTMTVDADLSKGRRFVATAFDGTINVVTGVPTVTMESGWSNEVKVGPGTPGFFRIKP